MKWLLSTLLLVIVSLALAAYSPVRHVQMERETVRGIVGDVIAEQAGILNKGGVLLP